MLQKAVRKPLETNSLNGKVFLPMTPSAAGTKNKQTKKTQPTNKRCKEPNKNFRTENIITWVKSSVNGLNSKIEGANEKNHLAVWIIEFPQ